MHEVGRCGDELGVGGHDATAGCQEAQQGGKGAGAAEGPGGRGGEWFVRWLL